MPEFCYSGFILEFNMPGPCLADIICTYGFFDKQNVTLCKHTQAINTVYDQLIFFFFSCLQRKQVIFKVLKWLLLMLDLVRGINYFYCCIILCGGLGKQFVRFCCY